MAIRPNTTCDIYRVGNAPPAAPDIQGVPCCFISCFDLGRERGEKEAQQYRFTARMLVAPSTDVRDNFNAWTGSATNRDTVFIPDKTGTGYKVNFVERINRGLATDALCVYLDRLAITWPFPGPAIMGLAAINPNHGPTAGGTSVVITGRGFTGSSAVAFGTTATTGFTVNSDTQITATSPAESAGTVDVTITTPLGVSGTVSADEFTFIPPPTVTNVSPNAGPTIGGTSVTITGTAFVSGATVLFGVTNGTSIVVVSSTEITVNSPGHGAATLDVTVTTAYGTSATSSADLFTFQQVATPTFSPAAGSYGPTQSVTISCATAGATIYYTTDGSTPTSGSSVYSGAISVSSTETIKAIAEESGYTDSAVGSATYTINGACATPTFSPAAGSYGSTQSVTISCSTGGATIYYTTDGSTPTSASTVYSGAISVAASETVQAIAELTGYSNSSVGSAAYTIGGGGGGGPALVQYAGNSPSSDDVTISQAFGSDVTAGNLILVAIPSWRVDTIDSITDSQGNSYTQAGSSPYTGGSGHKFVAIYYAIAGSSGPCTVTYTATGTYTGGSIVNGGYLNIAIHEFSGATTISSMTSTNGTSSTPTEAVTVSGSNKAVFAVYEQGDVDLTSCTAGNGFTLMNSFLAGLDGGMVGYGCAYVTGVSSDQTPLFTLSDSVGWSIAAVVLS